jgi:hypothetical protein
VCAYPSGRKSFSAAARKEKNRRELNSVNLSSNSTPTGGVLVAHSLSNNNGNGRGNRTPASHGIGNGDSSCRTDGNSNGLRIEGLLTGADHILKGFGNSPNVRVDGDDGKGAGSSVTRVEGKRTELIDMILGCEETGGIYEDQSTLTVSFSIRDSDRGRCGCL